MPDEKNQPTPPVKAPEAAAAPPNSTEAKDTPAPPAAPAIKTSKTDSFESRKMAQLEGDLINAEKLEGTRRLQAVATLRAQMRELRERESKRFSGADIRTPRGNMLHAEEAVAKRPEFHYRYINISAVGKAENAQALGYEKVPDSEGGKTLGDLALFRVSLERHAEMVGAKDVETRRKIDRVKDDLRGEVKEMAAFLRRKGVDIDERRLGVFEGEDK